MNKNAIKKFATDARRELISRVGQRALKYGISDKEIGNPKDDSVNGHLLSSTEKKQRAALIEQIKEKGYEQVMEEVAYTWFNRFSALRFMEVNGYLPTRVRVFTDENNAFKPQILTEAIHMELDGLDMEKVYAYKEANDNDELYKYLLITQCNALNVGLISYVKYNPQITLTQEGASVDLSNFDVKTEVRDKARTYWEEHSAKNKTKNKPAVTPDVEDEDNESSEDELLDDFKVKLQSAIANMSPAKFEQFSRALLTKMGVQFTNKGVQISNDGGIDGYGYHIDDDDFRTTRVVIQCKRFNANPVSEPDINQFLGAMNKFQADYGVFITNSRFTNKAREAAREGTPITLIDGNDLIRLVIKYELFITPVTTYVLDDFYSED